MKRAVKARTLTGVMIEDVREYEVRHRAVARRAAADGMVLLRNEGGILPLSTERPVALYGAGAVVTIKGGTGSGDVNSRPAVTILEGLKNAGFTLTTEGWLSQYRKDYDAARAAWREEILGRVAQLGNTMGDGGAGVFGIYSTTIFRIPSGTVPQEKEPGDNADTAIFVLARTAGEGADRHDEPGDFRLTQGETDLLHAVCRLYAHVILVLNIGGLMDLGFTDEPACANIEAILYIHQPGMEAGNAFADVLTGAVNPSAKLTDTWGRSYADYPGAASFSHNNGDVTREEYLEGIYVGYRYFDTFDVPVRYGFGYGLSYTQFSIRQIGASHYDLGTDHPEIGIRVCVTNTGAAAGREVVQVYVSCPQEGQEKEFRRLVGYGKTTLLPAGASQELEVRFPLERLSVYDEVQPGWVIGAGRYIVMVGNCLQNTQTAAVLTVEQNLVVSNTKNICPLQTAIDELSQDEVAAHSVKVRREALLGEAQQDGRPEIFLHEGDIVSKTFVYDGAYDNTPQEVRDFVDTLTTDQLILLVTGDLSKAQGAGQTDEEAEEEKNSGGQLGSAGTAVPGSAAQTSDCAAAQGLPDIVLADGPAGLRITKSYQALNGMPQPANILAALEGGYLAEGTQTEIPGSVTYYQYCTAFPVGTQLAQSWDPEMLRTVGAAVGEELVEFGVTLWLAPGMNIHRNPLCGRNFEYYSEDPIVAGLCAAAMTDGVQSVKGVGTTVKHYACNNQEDNRMGVDSILSERTLREIYLKGFEIAVRRAQPMSIMTSYNLINGVHAANCGDICTDTARSEWGFRGVIMTDWTTTMNGPDCTASGCMRAGNDLVMPGAPSDHENLRAELAAGTLAPADLKRSVARLVNIAWQSNYAVQEETGV